MITSTRLPLIATLAAALHVCVSTPALGQAAVVERATKLIQEQQQNNKYSDYGTGLPRDITSNGVELKRDPNGMHCTGFTFTVAFDVLTAADKLKGLSKEQFEKFHRDWYGLGESDSKERGLHYAVTQIKLGEPVTLDDLAPGNLVFFWRVADPAARQGMGPAHAAIITGVRRTTGKKLVGIKYISVQRFTTPPGTEIPDFEYLDDTDDDGKTKLKRADGKDAVVTIDKNRLYAAKLTLQ